jgi:GTP-binding protein Era
MARRVEVELEGSDAALLILSGEQGVGPGDRFIAARLAAAAVPVVVAVNKIDRLTRPQIAAALEQAAALEVAGHVFAVSARTGAGVAGLVEHMADSMPAGPFLFEPGEISDQPRDVILAELVREQVIRRTFHEVPHAVEVVIEDVDRSRHDLARVRALIWVESESQKGIVIGAGGRMIKAVGIAARRELERELDARVHLDVSVRVRRHWRADEGLLDRLGIE